MVVSMHTYSTALLALIHSIVCVYTHTHMHHTHTPHTHACCVFHADIGCIHCALLKYTHRTTSICAVNAANIYVYAVIATNTMHVCIYVYIVTLALCAVVLAVPGRSCEPGADGETAGVEVH